MSYFIVNRLTRLNVVGMDDKPLRFETERAAREYLAAAYPYRTSEFEVRS